MTVKVYIDPHHMEDYTKGEPVRASLERFFDDDIVLFVEKDEVNDYSAVSVDTNGVVVEIKKGGWQ